MKRKLTVTASLYTEFSYNIKRSGSKHLVFFIGKRYSRCYYYRIARVNSYGVYIFHRTYRKNVSCAVAQNFEFDFLPAANKFFNQYLRNRRKHQSVMRNHSKLFFVFGNSATRSAERIGRTYDYRITDFFRDCHALFYGISYIRGNDRLIDFLHRFLKQLPIFRSVD